MPDYITLELVSIPQFGKSAGRRCSLVILIVVIVVVIVVELLECCAANTLLYITIEMEPFTHQET